MLTYVDGSLFESPARVLVNTVNVVGVMGKGIAKDFKYFFPEMFRDTRSGAKTRRSTSANYTSTVVNTNRYSISQQRSIGDRLRNRSISRRG